jgi:mevalonate kinase
MTQKADIFYGKVLLFGEYSILFNSKGLTIPYTHFTGQLSFIDDDKYTDYEFALQSNNQLKEFLDFMLELEANAEMPCWFDFKRLAVDIEKGLYFESNIHRDMVSAVPVHWLLPSTTGIVPIKLRQMNPFQVRI